MTLEELRKKAIYQNTIDTWIAACDEKNVNWYEPEKYQEFIGFLKENQLKMQKFPLCIKESGGMYERGQDKTKFAEILSQSEDPKSAAYTIKLDDKVIELIRKFNF